ncbi:MAG: hypothetical protein V5A50_13955 [Thiohalorhabdus sp.]|uniref:hypothetical protein n=1 Tax=Thiohalorhabdus sp. TaxID=3094134 RepID=UPI002FC2EE96
MADLFVGNTMEVPVNNLRDQDGNAVTGATVEVTVLDREGTEVSGATWPITASDDGSGNYSATLPPDLDLTVGTTYEVRIEVSGVGPEAKWREYRQAKRRTF